jgi:hypothetical protein
VVDVPHGAYVEVGLVALEFLFGHWKCSLYKSGIRPEAV